MKAPNRFIYYANPLQWAKFFRKSLQSKGFYNFTFKKDGEFDHIWIKVNDGDETQLSVNDTFKLYQGDTLKYRVDDSLKDRLGCHAIIGEEEENIFQVPSETALTSTFRPSNCTMETTKVSGTIVKESFQTVPSKTDMDFFVQFDYELPHFNFTISIENIMGSDTVQIKKNDEDYVSYTNDSIFEMSLGDKIEFKHILTSGASIYSWKGVAENSGNPIAIFKTNQSTTEVPLYNYFENNEDSAGGYLDNWAQLVEESFEQGPVSGDTLTLHFTA